MLLEHDRTMTRSTWSPDGQWLLFATSDLTTVEGGDDIFGFRPGTDSVAVPLVATSTFDEWDPALSPDGRWLAYASDESGNAEVYVRPFPDVESGRVRISTEGGILPVWSRSGDELFFVDAALNLVSARVDATSSFTVTAREVLFFIGPAFGMGSPGSLEISLDDQRFLMARIAEAAEEDAPRFVLVQNFFEVLRQVEAGEGSGR